ncbi:autotransporter outer membrane beta-barrel domain-containing protein [bacterium]|nr:autotransporter outer membrane beta-barrel domain-containing protein [bacterium]
MALKLGLTKRSVSRAILTVAALFSVAYNPVQAEVLELSTYTPTLGDKSAYELTPSLDALADNKISLYNYDTSNHVVNVIDKEINLTKKEYGSGNVSRTVSASIAPNYNVDITVKYPSDDLASHITLKRNQTTGDISGNFVDLNTPYSYSSYQFGGAIANYLGTNGDISGLFLGNNVESSTKQAWGGAIIIRGNTGSISADFIDNHVRSTASEGSGGAFAIANYSVESIVGDFIGNWAEGVLSGGYGGAIYTVNDIDVGLIKGNFIGNYTTSPSVEAFGGAISIYRNSEVIKIEGDFIGNYADATTTGSGGAIGAIGTYGSINGDFINNYVTSKTGSAYGGAIFNGQKFGGTITGNFVNNFVKSKLNAYGGAIYMKGGTESIVGDFFENYAHSTDANAYGGALYVTSSEIKNITSSFIANHATSDTGSAKGGAIYTVTDLTFSADNKDIVFVDNYTESNGVKDDNAIYVENADATLKFNLKNNANLVFKDNVDGTTGYNLEIVGDNTSTLYLLNDFRNADLTLANTMINTINNETHTYELNSLTIQGVTDIVADIDPVKEQVDRFKAGSYAVADGASLNVSNLNILSIPTKEYTSILFADEGLKDSVTYNGIKKITTPVYVYDVSYKNNEDGGYFVFAGGSSSSGTSGYNPAVLASPASAAVGAVGTMNQTMNYAFVNADANMNFPYAKRMAIRDKNKYALAGDATDVGTYSPLMEPSENGRVWVKPYVVFENVPLKNGPKVSNVSYGTLIGFDSEMESVRRGWDRVITGFVGYNGASQNYSGVDSVQNGGLVGGTVTMYKGNFFNALTVNVGANVADNQTMYGSEDFAMLMAGVGNKVGYNIEVNEGKLIIQPSMLMSYTFVNAFDYTNAAGVSIDNKPLHSIQLSPGVKVIGNLKDGFQPYAAVSMVWNLMGETNATANGMKLPEVTIKPYVQYGVGIQKQVKDKFTAYGQAMVQNGGRNGISLTAGFRWALGRDKKYDNERVKYDDNYKKVLKEVKARPTVVFWNNLTTISSMD